MEFITSLFLSVATFFGLADPAMNGPAPMQGEIAMEEQMEVSMEDGEMGEEHMDDMANSADDMSVAMSDDEQMDDVEPDMTGEVKPVENTLATPPEAYAQTMLVAGGCFWCVESDLEKIPGVLSVVSGYAGGSTENPTYDTYGKGGHREVVEVTYNPNQVSFEDILIVTMKTTDPTDDDGTFYDRGDKYSSAFYYETDEQKRIIESLIAEVDQYGPYDEPLAIDVEERPMFWPAEDYHQDYYKGTLSQLKYKYYRNASGRDDFIGKYWSDPHSSDLPWRNDDQSVTHPANFWTMYKKPSEDILKEQLSDIEFKVTQEDGTERAGTSPLDKNYERGIYVDILSGEPLYSSKDKYDSGTGWPSFVKPITEDAVTKHEDRKLFTTRTEIRSKVADNHLGHVFDDGPADRGGLRYCMNGAALEFVPESEMEERGYGEYLQYL